MSRRWIAALALASCSSPGPAGQHPAPVTAAPDAAGVGVAAADRWTWPGWSGCVAPAASEFLAVDGQGRLVAIDAASLERRVFVDGVGRAAIDPLHRVVWLNNGAGMWTIDLSAPCAAPRAALLGDAGGDFGIDFGRDWKAGSVSTNCASY